MQDWFINPKPYTLNSNTLNSKPLTLTLNPKPLTNPKTLARSPCP